MALLTLLANLVAFAVLAGLAQAIVGCWAVRRFRAWPAPCPTAQPGVTVLKPLHGDEPLLEPALASVCAQD